MPRHTWTILTVIVGALIVFLSTYPLQLPPIADTGISVDKLGHFLAYFVLATNLGMALDFEWRIKNHKQYVFFSCFFLGLTLEIIQGYALVYRSFEALDLLANTLGILAFILLAKTIKKIVVKSGIFIN